MISQMKTMGSLRKMTMVFLSRPSLQGLQDHTDIVVDEAQQA